MGNSTAKSGLISKIATSTSTDYNAARLMMAEEDYDDEMVEPGLMIDCKDQLLKCGQMVDGQYKIEKLIGKGTYAQVYKAEKKGTNSGEKVNVAIKCCYSRNDQDWKLITSEILAMKSLNHANVLEFYEYFEIKKEQTPLESQTTGEDSCVQRNEPLVGIVMEYCNNGSIGDFLKRNKHMNADLLNLVDWFIQSIKGLSYCHKMNLCHRDIKPHNILIHLPPDSTSQVIKLCDFGLSSLLQDKKEKLNTFCGSPIYAAPEINRLCYSLSVDIYSLGISSLEMLSKIENKEFHGRMYNKSRDISVLTKVISNIPLKCLRKIITAMTQFEAKDRITGEELLTHPIIKALESTIIMSKGLYSGDNLENANEEYIETICELLGYYQNDSSKFEVLFQQLSQLFEAKPQLFVDVITKQVNQIGDEFLFTQGVSLEAQSCILFILISVGVTLCSQETPVPNRHSSLMDKKSSLYNVFVDSLTVISEHSPHISEDADLLRTNIHLIANIKQFILEFANIAGETIQTTILSFLIQTLMMDTANRSPPKSPKCPSNDSPKNTSLFTIDDKSFVFNLIREMVVRFESCKEIVILKNKQMPIPSTTTMTNDHYVANRISHSFGSSTHFLVASGETTTTTTTTTTETDEKSNELLSSEASIELRLAFLRAVHQRLLSSLIKITFPNQLDRLQVLCELVGSSKPKKVQCPDTNNTFVMKFGFNPEHMLNEFRVNLCYSNFGCNIPPSAIYLNDKLSDVVTVEKALKSDSSSRVTVLSQFIENSKTWKEFQASKSVEECNVVRREISKHFVLDCLFANRDVIGMDDCNILIAENASQSVTSFVAYRIDNGGSLSFRAQGKKKEVGEWTEFVSEINLFVDESFNKNTGNMFSGFVNQDSILQQTLELLSNAERFIFPFLDPTDVQIVQQRLDYLQNILGMFSVSSSALNSNTLGIDDQFDEATEANPELVLSLMEMGFPREQCEMALIASNNNIDTALSFLFN